VGCGDAWFLCLFLIQLADVDCQENAGILAESLGKLTALQELNLDEGAEMLVVSLDKLTALRKLNLRGTA
jgi:hypothetical protein